MRRFSDLHPVVITVWFFSVTGIAMFCSYPPLMVIGLTGAVILFLVRNGFSHKKTHLYFWLLFAVLALANPIISHNGKTVLFVLNNNPVTLEATLYGLNSAAMILGVLYWFRSFTQIMTSEKLLCVTGALSPKLSLVLSMALRSVPMFGRQSRKITDSQKAMGLFSEDNIIDDIKGRMRVFSILITWALENGIITADSMAARGYGTARRTQMRRFRFFPGDVLFLLISLALLGVCCAAVSTDSLGFSFYPDVKIAPPGVLGTAGIICYAALVLLPVINETGVKIRWRYLMSGM